MCGSVEILFAPARFNSPVKSQPATHVIWDLHIGQITTKVITIHGHIYTFTINHVWYAECDSLVPLCMWY
jgi:hypothetical protein